MDDAPGEDRASDPLLIPARADAVERAARMIRRGAVVAFPTETVYGLAADATDALAVAAVLAAKKRPQEQAIPALVANQAMLDQLVTSIPPLARRLMASHWPGPLTLVLPGRSDLPRPMLNSAGGVGVRVSADPVAHALVTAVGRPITATSANRTGQPPAQWARAAKLSGVALVLDGGKRDQMPSTVLDLLDAPRIIRQGALRLDLDRL